MNLTSRINIFFCLSLLLACNNTPKDQEQPQDNTLSAKNISADKISKKEKEPIGFNPKWRSKALVVLDYRIQNENKTYAIIDANILEYQHVYDGSRMSRPEEQFGNWIDFKEDFTYDYGNFDNIQGAGRYHYSQDKKILLMIDNREDENPQEWNIKSAGDVIIMVGSHTYKNNAFQMKLERVPERPKK